MSLRRNECTRSENMSFTNNRIYKFTDKPEKAESMWRTDQNDKGLILGENDFAAFYIDIVFFVLPRHRHHLLARFF